MSDRADRTAVRRHYPASVTRRLLTVAAAAALALLATGCTGDEPAAQTVAPTAAPTPATTTPGPDAEACRLIRALTAETELEPVDLANIGRLASLAQNPDLAAAGRNLADAAGAATLADDPRGEPMIRLAEARLAVAKACDG